MMKEEGKDFKLEEAEEDQEYECFPAFLNPGN